MFDSGISESEGTSDYEDDDNNNNNLYNPVDEIHNWEEGYHLLRAFHKRYGTTEVPISNRQYRDLYHWIWAQRKSFKHGLLTNKQMRRLKRIGFVWNPQKIQMEYDPSYTYDDSLDLGCYSSSESADDRNENASLGGEVDNVSSSDGAEDAEEVQNVLDRLEPPVDNPHAIKNRDKWIKNYLKYKKFRKKHGSAKVKFTDDRILAWWVQRQQYRQRDGKLRQDMFKLLDELQFPWIGSAALSVLERGSRKVTSSTTQTREKKKGGPANDVGRDMDTDTDEIVNPKHEAKWIEKYNQLKAFKKQHGHVDLPSTGRDISLYTWTNWQRRMYREKKLSKSRKRKLKKLGFDWRAPTHRQGGYTHRQDFYEVEKDSDDNTIGEEKPKDEERNVIHVNSYYESKWQDKYKELKAFYKKHGNFEVSMARDDANESLYFWIARQRKQYRQNVMPENRRQLLKKLGLFNDNDETAPTLAPVPVPSSDIRSVASAVEENKPRTSEPATADDYEYYGYQDISAEFSAEEIGSESEDEDTWTRRYEKLKKYKEKYNCVTVPLREGDGFESLALWSMKQQKLYKESKLSSNRKRKLSKLGFYFGPGSNVSIRELSQAITTSKPKQPSESHQRIWMASYEDLKKFKEKYGALEIRHSDVDHKPLYIWMTRQRSQRWKGMMTNERKALLDAIDFPWQAPAERRRESMGSTANQAGASVKTAEKDEDEEENEEGLEPPLKRLRSNSFAKHDDRFEQMWMDNLRHLKNLKRRHGKMEIGYPDMICKGRKSLYNWICRQRRLYKDGKQPAYRKKLLDDIGFSWTGRGKQDEVPIKCPGDSDSEGYEGSDAESNVKNDAAGSESKKEDSASFQYDLNDAAAIDSTDFPGDLDKADDLTEYLNAVEKKIDGKKSELERLKRRRNRLERQS